MTIGVDAGCLGIKDERLKVGVYQVAKNLLEELEKFDAKNTYLLYSFYPIEKALLRSFGKNVKNIVVKPARGWTKIWLPLQLLKDKPDIFIGLNQSLPLKLPLQTYKSIVLIHDLLFEAFPKFYPGSYRKLHKESKLASQKADRIIAVSQATKTDLENFYGISENKITVIPEGVRKFARIKGKELRTNKENAKFKVLNPKYFLFVGALKPQKNVPILIKAFADIQNPKSKIQNPNLLIVGGDMWRDRKIDKTVNTLPEKVKERIQFLGVVDDAMLFQLYKHAIAFVSPSLSEGFGLAFLESLSFGVPVIGPNTGSVPEVVGGAGILIDPVSSKNVQLAMEKMLDGNIRSSYAQKALYQAQKFTWEKFAKKFFETMEALA